MSYQYIQSKARLLLKASSTVHQMGPDFYEAAGVLRDKAHKILMASAAVHGFGTDFNPYQGPNSIWNEGAQNERTEAAAGADQSPSGTGPVEASGHLQL